MLGLEFPQGAAPQQGGTQEGGGGGAARPASKPRCHAPLGARGLPPQGPQPPLQPAHLQPLPFLVHHVAGGVLAVRRGAAGGTALDLASARGIAAGVGLRQLLALLLQPLEPLLQQRGGGGGGVRGQGWGGGKGIGSGQACWRPWALLAACARWLPACRPPACDGGHVAAALRPGPARRPQRTPSPHLAQRLVVAVAHLGQLRALARLDESLGRPVLQLDGVDTEAEARLDGARRGGEEVQLWRRGVCVGVAKQRCRGGGCAVQMRGRGAVSGRRAAGRRGGRVCLARQGRCKQAANGPGPGCWLSPLALSTRSAMVTLGLLELACSTCGSVAAVEGGRGLRHLAAAPAGSPGLAAEGGQQQVGWAAQTGMCGPTTEGRCPRGSQRVCCCSASHWPGRARPR
jgi:hypothetical protein